MEQRVAWPLSASHKLNSKEGYRSVKVSGRLLLCPYLTIISHHLPLSARSSVSVFVAPSLFLAHFEWK